MQIKQRLQTAKMGNTIQSFHKADNMVNKPGEGRCDFSDFCISINITR
jgi:hypothetical protein